MITAKEVFEVYREGILAWEPTHEAEPEKIDPDEPITWEVFISEPDCSPYRAGYQNIADWINKREILNEIFNKNNNL